MNQNKSFNVVAFGEVLWDLLPDQAIIGGAPFNFAYRAGSLGHRTYIVSRVGRDDLGDKALRKVRDLGMSTTYIQRDSRFPTGTVEVFLDEHKKPDYHIIAGVAYDHIRVNEAVLSLAGSADCLCFGTLAQRSRASRETLQALLSTFQGRYRLYDINLRKDCYDRAVIHASLTHADIVKLNDEEAREVNGLLALHADTHLDIGKALLRQYPVSICVITFGEHGVLAVSSDNEVVYEPGYRVLMRDPLGAGDAFSAGFISGLLSGSGLREACRFGNRLGAVVATQAGATQMITGTEMQVMAGKSPSNIQPELAEFIHE
jgi:fructokinase